MAVAAAAMLALVVVAIQVVVELHGWMPGDRLARWLFEHPRTYRVQRIGHAIGQLGLPPVAVATVLALATYARATAGVRAAAMAVASSGVVAVSAALKLTFGPSDLMLLHEPASEGTLPSGHTAYATSVFGFAALLFAWRRRWLAAAGAACVVLAMGPSRVAAGAHWPSDVAAGYALGAAWLLVVLVVGLPPRRPAELQAARPASVPPRRTAGHFTARRR